MSQLLSRAGGINWVFLSDSSVAGARQMLSRCSVCWSGEACVSHSGAYRSRVLNAEMALKRQNGRSMAAKAANTRKIPNGILMRMRESRKQRNCTCRRAWDSLCQAVDLWRGTGGVGRGRNEGASDGLDVQGVLNSRY